MHREQITGIHAFVYLGKKICTDVSKNSDHYLIIAKP